MDTISVRYGISPKQHGGIDSACVRRSVAQRGTACHSGAAQLGFLGFLGSLGVWTAIELNQATEITPGMKSLHLAWYDVALAGDCIPRRELLTGPGCIRPGLLASPTPAGIIFVFGSTHYQPKEWGGLATYIDEGMPRQVQGNELLTASGIPSLFILTPAPVSNDIPKANMWPIRLHTWLQALILTGLLVPVSFTFPLGGLDYDGSILTNDTAGATAFNDALNSQSIRRRGVIDFYENVGIVCDHRQFGPLLEIAWSDAVHIMENMIQHLDLIFGMYQDDHSGKLKPEKIPHASRTYDEHNAWMSYNTIISRIYYGAKNEAKNAEGMKRLKFTRDAAVSVLKKYKEYQEGQKSGDRHIHVLCTEKGLYDTRNSDRETYEESHPGKSRYDDGAVWIIQRRYGPSRDDGEVWVRKKGVCGDGSTKKEMYDVPTKAMRAYVYGPAEPKLLNEVMMFCPHKFNSWEIFERKAIAANIHYGDLHVPIGSKATAAQKASVSTLMAKDSTYDPKNNKDSSHMIPWLGSFLVTTLLHEAMHSNVLAGAEYHLGQEKHIGHKGAEAFSMYAMAVYNNAVFWHRGYMPYPADSWLDKVA
ncbi:hypothetical protein PG994_002765 [Apiospora phragmitis]|uniref:Lysine-specific metallo-endopeptidase domain-containing protein n=1 Tax=Apiospora phragmitis TaxID=2905665 RepID=A0ABR1W623_9PEZI